MKKLVSLFLAAMMLLSVLPLAVAEEEVPTLTVMMMDNGRTWDPETTNNKKIQEILGVKLDVTTGMKADTMNMQFASGELADIITLNKMDYTEYLDSGYLLPLNDLLEKYGPTIMERTTEFGLQCCTVDGKIYGFPYENNNVKYFTEIRKDWLDNLGYDLSKYTQIEGSDVYNIPMEDYIQMLRDFTFKDPDGNGKNDTYGLTFHGASSIETQFMAFYGAFGGVMTQYYLKDNTVWPFEATDDFRAALEQLHALWVEGVIDPEIFILQQDQARANLMSGKSGSFVAWWSTAYELIRDGMWDMQPTAEWISCEIVGPDGKVGMKDNGRISNTVHITTSCKNPELAMQVLDKLNTEEVWWLIRYGVAGEHYNVDENGNYSGTRTEAGQKLFEGMRMDTLYNLTNCIELENIANSVKPTDEKMLVRYGKLIHQFIDAPLYHDLFYGMATTDEYKTYSVDVQNTVNTAVMNFVTGAVELNDANWQAYLNNWKSMGGADVLKSYVDAYNKLNNTAYEPAL